MTTHRLPRSQHEMVLNSRAMGNGSICGLIILFIKSYRNSGRWDGSWKTKIGTSSAISETSLLPMNSAEVDSSPPLGTPGLSIQFIEVIHCCFSLISLLK